MQGISPIPSSDFRRSAGLLCGKICSDRAENGESDGFGLFRLEPAILGILRCRQEFSKPRMGNHLVQRGQGEYLPFRPGNQTAHILSAHTESPAIYACDHFKVRLIIAPVPEALITRPRIGGNTVPMPSVGSHTRRDQVL